MANIRDSVNKAFEVTKDFRISYLNEEVGATPLISNVYGLEDKQTQKFYQTPEIAEGTEVKLAVIYGETMITPYIIDAGVSTGTNDPASIVTTIRFLTGIGETEGIPNGPNGTPLQNVYIGAPDEVPQPIIDSDGRPSTKDVILASLLGGAIQSAPAIWDLIVDAVPDDDIVTGTDPVTGQPILSKGQKDALKTTGNIPVEALSNVDASTKGNDYVLAWDNCSELWVTKHINELLSENTSITGAEGGAGGSGGAGGGGGDGGAGGDGGFSDTTIPPLPVDPAFEPDNSPAQEECDPVPRNTSGGLQELPDFSALQDNEYKEDIDVRGTNGIILNFLAEGNGKKISWSPANAVDPESCFTDPNAPVGTNSTEYFVSGQFDIEICISTTVCGKEYLLYQSTHSEVGCSSSSYTFRTAEIAWCSLDISGLISDHPGQVFNDSNPNVTVRLRRMDGDNDDLCPGSDFPLHYEGITFNFGEDWYNCGVDAIVPPITDNYPLIPAECLKDDDGWFPDQGPQSSGFSASTCPSPEGSVIPGQPPTFGEPGQPGDAGGSGGGGTPGSGGNVEVAPPPAIPQISLESPCSRVYLRDEFGTPIPVDIPNLIIETTNGTPTVDVTYDIMQGEAVFHMDPIPGNVTVTGNDTLKMIISGTDVDVSAASANITVIPQLNVAGEILWRVKGLDSDNGCAGLGCEILPNSLIIDESAASCSFFDVDTMGSGDTIQVFYTETFTNGPNDIVTTRKSLNSAPIVFATNITTTIQNCSDDLNGFVNASNSTNQPGSTAWLPLFIGTPTGNRLKVCGPKEAGADFNDYVLDIEVTGGATIGLDSILDFLGGVSKNISDVLQQIPLWNEISDILLPIAGNVAGAVIGNILLNNTSNIQITIPTGDDVTVTFLYRGLKVNVPTEYDAPNRTGTPNFDAWSGTWKKVWTDSPAWCLLDFIENTRYGLGQQIILTTAQKELLLRDIFTVSSYCDEVVPDDNGVNQARFSLNTAITDGTKIEILGQLCSLFFGSYVFHNGGLRIRADMPDPIPTMLVNQSSVGNITYEHTTLKSFVNKASVTYVEPSNFYNTEVAIAENNVAITKYGEKQTEVFAFGTTNRGQALRYSNWILNSEKENALLVSYNAGWDHYRAVPGDIVQFEDSNDRGIRLAGRIVSIIGTDVVLDGDVVVSIGDGFSVTQDDGTVFETTVVTVTDNTHISIALTPTAIVSPNNNFIIADQTIGKRLFRVVKVDETSDGKFSTTIQLYNLDKYNKIIARTTV